MSKTVITLKKTEKERDFALADAKSEKTNNI